MAYDETKLSQLAHLKSLGKKVKAQTDAVAARVTALESVGSQANKIETIQVNGTAQTITNKTVNIAVPTKTSQLTNDSTYQTSAQVASSIQTAIAKTGHASFKKVDSIPTASTAEENVLYLVKNATTGHYDIYALVSGVVELLDDTTVDLSGYVQKETGKGLSANDFTAAYKSKLDGIEANANKYVHPSYTARAAGLYKVTVDALGHVSAVAAVTKADITALGIPATNTTYNAATSTAAGLMSAADKSKLDGMNIATDAEVAEMLTEVFG